MIRVLMDLALGERAIVLGLALWAVIAFWLHFLLFGVSPLPG